jgi:hypothetical protein
MNKPRPRKPITAARIRVTAWFRSEAHYLKWASIGLGRVDSIDEFGWVSAELLDGPPIGAVRAVYVFTHTARNDGAQNSDSRRFFHVTRRAANISETDCEVESVELVRRVVVAL